ncbi:alpha/beta fold hydrolase [Celerinatantimonas yamalensis]|uniref:Alpha/beta fold hydrolase n=1 Tax=Celerinatantimonas yamalensis TaxID=559956 RepID=A0ABW9GB51_9GAMM
MQSLALPAPFSHADYVTGACGRQIFYCHTPLDDSNRTLVLIAVGRNETGLKYTDFAHLLASYGCAVVVCDHRGQGFSERLNSDPMLGDVEKFQFYIDDLKALYQHCQLGRFSQRYLLGHSMGGAITALYAARYPDDFQKLALLSPMFAIHLGKSPLWQVRWQIRVMRTRDKLRKQNHYAPGQRPFRWPPFTQNIITHSQSRYQALSHLFESYPKLGIGGPSNRWLNESFQAMAAIARLPKLPLAMLLLSAKEDCIVDNRAQTHFVEHQRQQGADISHHVISGAYHELLQEQEPIRQHCIELITDFFIDNK